MSNVKRNAAAQNHTYIIILGGIPIVGDGRGSPIGSGFTWQGNAIGGVSIVNENAEEHPQYQNRYESLIAHEFGHALSLKHNFDNNTVMGGLPLGGPNILTDFEARLLSKHSMLTGFRIENPPPQIINDLQLEPIGRNIIRFKIRVTGSAELYHLQLERGMNCIGSAKLNGKDFMAEIDVPRTYLHQFTGIKVTVFDINGNKGSISLPEPIFPKPILENNSTFKYLTIRGEDADMLTPINQNIDEWVGWKNAGIFEKLPDGANPVLPNWYVHVPILNEWDSWFYSHAKSRFVYDISENEYNRFESHFYLPCGETTDVEVICFADDIIIYQSEILRIPEAQNKHFQIDIPKGTNKFTIQVTDAGDGIRCDHFIFGEAKVLIVENNIEEPLDEEPLDEEPLDEEPLDEELICEHCLPDQNQELEITIEEDLGVNVKNKLTIKWATIKARR